MSTIFTPANNVSIYFGNPAPLPVVETEKCILDVLKSMIPVVGMLNFMEPFAATLPSPVELAIWKAFVEHPWTRFNANESELGRDPVCFHL